MKVIKKKRGGRGKKGKKSKLNDAENLSFNDEETAVEDLKLTEDVMECFGEGEIDEKNVIERVKLF